MGKIKEWVYLYGFKAGFALILLPIVKDIILRNGREWNLASIGVVGITIQLIGVGLMLAGGRDSK